MKSSMGSRWNYLIAVLILAGSAAAIRLAPLTLIKKALPIRRPLRDLDRQVLKPYEFLRSHTLPAEIVHELGTEEYIDWTIRDLSTPEEVVRRAALSISYYTNVQDQVPHVPEECYHQNAFVADRDDYIGMDLVGIPNKTTVRRMTFFPPQETVKKSVVYYVFGVNGGLYSDRDSVRTKMGDPRDTHLYYSKVEVAFSGAVDSNLPELDRRAAALFESVLAELIKNHWPEKGAERK